MKLTRLLVLLCCTCFQRVAVIAQAPCPYSCTPVAFHQFRAGMDFYFPPSQKRFVGNPDPDYRLLKPGTDSVNDRIVIDLNKLVGRTFRIEKILIDTAKSRRGAKHFLYDIYLADKNSLERIRYRMIVDLDKLTGRGSYASKFEHYVIEGAISLDEITQAQQLIGKSFYSVFPINNIRYTQITITHVDTGFTSNPLIITYTDPTGLSYRQPLVGCGTNVHSSYRDEFAFRNFFSCVDKFLGQVIPVKDMSAEEVISRYGTPTSDLTKLKDGVTIRILKYTNWVLTFVKNKLINID